MADHLKLDSQSATIKHFTEDGAWTVNLLQLNSPDMRKYRRTTMTAVNALQSQRLGIELDIAKIAKKVADGSLAVGLANELVAEINSKIAEIDEALLDLGIGSILPPVRATILGFPTTVP